jgi:5'-nucleotidase (lipoprotein e(P4) family)
MLAPRALAAQTAAQRRPATPSSASAPTKAPAPAPTPPSAATALEIKYVRDSDEYATLTRQVYRAAATAVESASKASPAAGPWAVVLDVDETALDNSVYELERAAYRLEFAAPSWNAWVRRAQANAVPGVEAFVQAVRRLGGRVAWITDRDGGAEADLTPATRENLAATGLWSDHDLLCTRKGNSKLDRRRELAAGSGPCSWTGEPVKIVAFVGDQMTDFPAPGETADVPKNRNDWDVLFGTRFFLLPNPMYGRWTSNVTRTEYR